MGEGDKRGDVDQGKREKKGTQLLVKENIIFETQEITLNGENTLINIWDIMTFFY